MIGICVACGSNGPLECHHVGRRKFSPVTTMVCIPCHTYCTIAGVYERVYPEDTPVIVRLWAGLMDIWNRFCESNDIPMSGLNALNDAEYRSAFRYRPCRQVPDQAMQNSEATLAEQVTELARLIQEITGYAYTDV